jgi:PAS domain S-box-containing protein
VPAFALISVLESSTSRLARRLGRRALWLAVAGAVLVIAAMAGLGTQFIRSEADRRAWVDHTYIVLEQLNAVQLDVNRMEALTRGYVITGDAARFLAPVGAVEAALNAGVENLVLLVRDNPAQVERVATLRRQLRVRIDGIERLAALKQKGDDAGAAGFLDSKAVGDFNTDERLTFLAIQDAERRLLVERERAAGAAEARAVNFAGFVGFLSVIVLLIAVFDSKRQADLRVEAEREIRKTEERFRILVEGIEDYAILMLDRQGHVASWSKGAERIIGYTAGEIIGQHFGCFYPVEDIRSGKPAAELSAAETEGYFEDEGWRLRKDGSRYWANVVITAMRDEAGGLIGFSKIERDLSERKRVEDDMRRAKEAAEAATRAKSDFLAAMSHELRTPMTGVLGMIYLLRTNPSPQDYTLFLDTLRTSAKTLMTVLGDILDFSKIEAGRLEMEQVDFGVPDLVRDVVDLFAGQASVKGLVIHMLREGGTASVARGDPTRLRQVLSNLVGNAIKFTHSGRIDVVLQAPEVGADLWRFEVRDTGVGFALDDNARTFLFDAFTQADLSTTRRFGGTGLGLAICKRLIDAMGGTIGAESAVDIGSTFWFEVPLEAGSSDAAGERPGANPFQRSQRALKVLVAEDNPVNQLIVTYMLQQMGHAAVCVENGRLAVERAREGGFDLVLMDMQMPEMDGATATRHIRDLPAPYGAVPIVALTADATTRRREEYFEAGLTDFLTKPIDAEALRAVLDRCTETIEPSE